jgi:tRNA(fMet)-specific endonuclease VapC
MHHLDTDVVIALLRGNHTVAERLKAVTPAAEISSLVLAELIYGALAAQDPVQARRRLDRFLPSLGIVPFDSAAAEAYGGIRLALRKKGRPIGDADTWIAAVAVARRATLVTHNKKHFDQIEGLETEDWLA